MGLVNPTLDLGAIEKAIERARQLGVDLELLSKQIRETSPSEVASHREQAERRRLLFDMRGNDPAAAQQFERIIAGNELQGVNFLIRGAIASRTIMRVVIRSIAGKLLGYGTGFLVGDGVLLTNNHVLPDQGTAQNSEVEAFFELGSDGKDMTVHRFELQPERLFYTSPSLDFSVVAVAPVERGGGARLGALGWLPLIGAVGKVLEGEWLSIIQHPKAERKQLCVRENQLLKRDTDVLWYSTDTLGGSSGAPVFNNDWLVVALHHSGIPETRNGHWQTIDGRDFRPSVDGEDQVKWKANEGIRVSRIVETLSGDAKMGRHPMIRAMLDVDLADISTRLPVNFAAGFSPPVDPVARSIGSLPTSTIAKFPGKPPQETNMSQRLVTVTLAIAADGSVSIVDSGAREANLLALEKTKPQKNVIHAPVDPAKHWGNGYRTDFLGTGDLEVHLPRVLNTADIVPLQNAYGKQYTRAQKESGVLEYDGYSIVMSKSRRFAFFSAANVSWDMRPGLKGRADDWLYDDRIERAYQVDNSYYISNDFDRGHLTRREDMEYGANAVEAVRRANSTCTWTNCTPQHRIFNQDRHPNNTIRLWHGLERYILEETVQTGQFSVQLFTGPIFGTADPEYRNIAYPLEYWKVVVAVRQVSNQANPALTESRLFATGYVLGQKQVIDQFGIEAKKEEPFGNYGMYQRPIKLIENLTGLRFTYGGGKSLSDVDPLERPTWRPRRRVRTGEAIASGMDDALDDFGDILLG